MPDKKILHHLYRMIIMVKGLDGFLDLIGSLILFLTTSSTLTWIVEKAFQHELIQDPQDLIATYLVSASHQLSLSTQHFGAVYLLVHGVIKIGLFFALYFEEQRFYPYAIVLLLFFIFYQLFRQLLHFSIIGSLLIFFDMGIVILLWFEYGNSKKR